MNVCLFTDSLEPSGVGSHMLALAGELASRHRVALVCPPGAGGDPLLARAAALGVPALALCVRHAAAEAELCRWLRGWRTDVLHVHAGIGWEGHHGVRAGCRAGVPVVRTEHLPYLLTGPAERAAYLRIHRRCERIICVSRGVRESYRAAGVPDRRLRTVRNGVPAAPPSACRVDARARLGIAPDAPLVLTVGRFAEQKGHRYLRDAVPAVRSRVPGACFVWVGDGPLRAALAESPPPGVVFTGPRGDVPDLVAAADLFVLPSLFEGLPLAVLEAMAAGVPVVGTRVCGLDEAVEDGVTGRLVPPADAGALADAIVQALACPAMARRWGRAGRRRVRAEFGVERMARETEAVYREARAAHRARITQRGLP